MDEYRVELNEQAQRDIESIFIHIAVDRLAPENAKAQTDRLYKKLKTLETFPYSHPKRTKGGYAGKDYRQLVIDNYLALYRVDESTKTVHIVTIQYQSRNI
jgi:addiction module RelE/StbE family toxin